MTVERGWQIELDQTGIAEMEDGSFDRIRKSPDGRRDWEETIEEAASLIEPAAVWDQFPVSGFRHDAVLLAGGARMAGGPLTTVVAGATHLIAAVCTVGERISSRIREHQTEGSLLKGLVLDHLGTLAVAMVRRGLCRRLRDEASRDGRHVSTSLSPGESQWPLQDQAVIFSLLDASQIGVSLSPSLLMSPLKSVSLVMGTGSQPMGREGGSNCDWCTMKDTCAYRSRRSE